MKNVFEDIWMYIQMIALAVIPVILFILIIGVIIAFVVLNIILIISMFTGLPSWFPFFN